MIKFFNKITAIIHIFLYTSTYIALEKKNKKCLVDVLKKHEIWGFKVYKDCLRKFKRDTWKDVVDVEKIHESKEKRMKSSYTDFKEAYKRFIC